jgi:hypothetical protein
MDIKQIEITEMQPKKSYQYIVGNKEFKSEYEAQRYILKNLSDKYFSNIPTKNSKLSMFENDKQNWFYCNSLDELLAVIYNYSDDKLKKWDFEGFKTLSFPDWFSVWKNDGGDYFDYTWFCSLKETLKQAQEMIDFANNELI